jgi:hypothetical protein
METEVSSLVLATKYRRAPQLVQRKSDYRTLPIASLTIPSEHSLHPPNHFLDDDRTILTSPGQRT